MTVTTSPIILHRLHHWVYAPAIAALVVGAVASGAGIGSADIVAHETRPESSTTVTKYAWRVHNFTDQTLTAGDFHRDEGANIGSALAFGGTTPWAALKPGEVTVDAFQPFGPSHTRTWGRICYKGQIWNMPRVATPVREDFMMMDWNDLYVFAMGPAGGERLMITSEHGKHNVDMNAYSETC